MYCSPLVKLGLSWNYALIDKLCNKQSHDNRALLLYNNVGIIY